MSHYPFTTPARLTEPATRKLPRLALLIFGLLYAYFGLFFREPWKTPDLAGLATMISAYKAHSPIFFTYPDIGGYLYTQEGILTSWIGAYFIKYLSPLISLFTSNPLDAQIIAARLPNFLYIFIILWGIWYGTYLLSRRKECQPLPLPFGGEPHPRDYGRMLADVAFMFMIATIGVIIPLHETSSYPLVLALLSISFYSFCRSLDHPYQGAFILGSSLCANLLTLGLISSLPVILSTLLLVIFCRAYTQQQRLSLLLGLLGGTTLFLIIIFITTDPANPYWLKNWWHDNAGAFGWSGWLIFFAGLRDLLWYCWPTWPFAIVAIIQWRHWYRAPHIFIPMVFMLSALFTILALDNAKQSEYALITIPMAVLASMSIPTLRRNVINALDWFAMMVLSLFMICIWIGWIALNFGWPHKIHHNIVRLLSGFEPTISTPIILLSLAICALWIGLIIWRLHLKPSALWRGTVLSSAGLICAWVLLALLWLPSINYNRSYRLASHELHTAINLYQKPGECVRSIGLGIGQRAALYVFDGISLYPSINCDLVLIQTTKKELEATPIPYLNEGTVLWRGGRKSDLHEVFLLVRSNKNK